MMKSICLIVLCLWSIAVFATQEHFRFDSPEQKARFYHLTKELRCLVCQNESLADSTASLAEDLRQEIYQQMMHGETDQVIKDFLVQRYGDFVLYKPSFKKETYALWFGPFLLLVLAMGGLVIVVRNSQMRQQG